MEGRGLILKLSSLYACKVPPMSTASTHLGGIIAGWTDWKSEGGH